MLLNIPTVWIPNMLAVVSKPPEKLGLVGLHVCWQMVTPFGWFKMQVLGVVKMCVAQQIIKLSMGVCFFNILIITHRHWSQYSERTAYSFGLTQDCDFDGEIALKSVRCGGKLFVDKQYCQHLMLPACSRSMFGNRSILCFWGLLKMTRK